jgi:Uma2 family endonuclease
MGAKLHKYIDAGVAECWLVDPDRKTVGAYVRTEGSNFTITEYNREETVPVPVP